MTKRKADPIPLIIAPFAMAPEELRADYPAVLNKALAQAAEGLGVGEAETIDIDWSDGMMGLNTWRSHDKKRTRRRFTFRPADLSFLRGFADGPDNPDYRRFRNQQIELFWKGLTTGFFEALILGEVAAVARVGSPLAPPTSIPASAWKGVRITKWHEGEAETSGGERLFDIRVLLPDTAAQGEYRGNLQQSALLRGEAGSAGGVEAVHSGSHCGAGSGMTEVEVSSSYWASPSAERAIPTGEHASSAGGPTEKHLVSADASKQLPREGSGQAGRNARPRSQPGRPKGTGYQLADEVLIAEMKQLVDSGQMPSPTKAAETVADRAQGASFDSKKRRLVNRFRERYPKQKNAE